MRIALAAFTASFLIAVVACVGGPGPLPGQGDDTTEVTVNSGGSSSGQQGTSSSSGTVPTSTGTSKPPPAPISVSSYNTSCAADTDCASVYQGSVCVSCRCPNAAIAKSDLTRYQTALATAAASCPSSSGAVGCDCAATQVHCDTSKHCVVGAPTPTQDAGF